MVQRYIVENLSDQHVELITQFDCGKTPLNRFLQEAALYYDKHGETRTKIVIDTQESNIVAYFTLKCSSILIPLPPKDKRTLPAVEIAWFALDKNYQGKGYGQATLAFVIDYINHIRETMLGAKLITLFSVPEAIEFYKKMGFKEIRDRKMLYCNSENKGCQPMYLVI